MDSKKKKIIIAIVVVAILLFLLAFFVFKDTKYTVKFSGNTTTTVEVSKGEMVTKPTDPTKEGYVFLGWYLNDVLYDFTKPVTKDITLVAKWEKTNGSVVITFMNEDGSILSTQSPTADGKITKPVDPTKEGYKFLGWFNGDTLFDFNSVVTSNISLTAKFEKEVTEETDENKVTYTVTFNSDGGSKVSSQKVEENKAVKKPTNPTKKGYAFVSWQLDGKDYNFSSKVTKDITLKATWKKVVTYTVTFNSNGGSSVGAKTVEEGTKVSKPSNPTRSGYAFVSWQLNGSDYNFNTPVTKDITLTAKWRELNRYTVTFNSNGGSSVSAQTVTEGSNATKPSNPTRSGYTFNNWQLSGKAFNFSTAITSNITLTASWTAKTYVIEATRVDQYSPTMRLTIKENGNTITNAKACSNGVALNGATIAESSLSKLNCVILSDGTQMPATVRR